MTNEFINNMLEVDEAYRCAFGDHSNHVHPAEVVDKPEEETPEEGAAEGTEENTPAVE